MDNSTSTKYFYILIFSGNLAQKRFITGVIFFIYFIGLLLNFSIITVICVDPQLYTPLYVFLCSLSIVDMCYTTSTVPKLLEMLLSGNNTMTFVQCFTQMFFFVFAAVAENMILASMAYDRYVAICNPLRYHHVLSLKTCVIIMVGVLFLACLNSIFFTYSASFMSFCHSKTIQQFFCDAKALTKISCAGVEIFFSVFGVEAMLFGVGPFLCSLMSYVKIISIILGIKSKDGSKKAFSTCSSHLMVIIMYYGAAASVYMISPSGNSDIIEGVFSVLYTTVAPMLNPLIYSLRSTDVKKAFRRLLGLDLKVTKLAFRDEKNCKS